MLMSSLRRKSRPAHITRPSPNASYPAGEASPVVIDGPQLLLTPHKHLGSQSSWHSRPSISPYPETSSVCSSRYDSLLPQQRYDYAATPSIPPTPTALRSLGDAAKQAVTQWTEDEPESPRGARRYAYMANEQRTAVSEYLRERAWIPPTPQASNYAPMPTAVPPPVPRLNHRRFSFSSDGVPRKGSRKVSARSRQSITTLPYPVGEDEEALMRQQSMIPIANPPTPSLTFLFSSPWSSWSRRKASRSWASETPAAPTPASTQTTASSTHFATPYDQTCKGPTPIPITSVNDYEKQVAKQSTRQSHEQSRPSPALTRGLTQKYTPGRGIAQKTPCRPKPAIAYRPDRIQPHQPSTQFQNFLHPNLRGGKFLCTRTTDTVYSDEASWLFIGTRRGPKPDEVREIDQIMTKARAKAAAKGENKHIEKGLKKIRKMCQEKSRGWCEWVEVYIRRKWGMELFC